MVKEEPGRSPPPTPGHLMHPTLLETKATGLHRLTKPEHRNDLLNLAWHTAKHNRKNTGVSVDFVKARLPVDRSNWLKTNVEHI